MRMYRLIILQFIFAALASISTLIAAPSKPNIIFMMADDLGIAHVETYGFDDGIAGQIKTPHLNAMAANGLRFDRFYAQAPVCSPTRASCYTGRHPYRMGIWEANTGHLRAEEVTLAEVLKDHGYSIGHFGKWHMGKMVTNDPKLSKKAGRMGLASPDSNGVDDWFAIHSAPTLYNPFSDGRPSNAESDNPYYENGQRATDNLEGDTSRIIMDRALPFIKDAAKSDQPFVAYIWFNTPHTPLAGNPKYQDLYHKWELYGPIVDMDEQVGRLREALRELGIADNTLLWFSSDNGPAIGDAGPYYGAKRHLFEGGIRVPTFVEWPGTVPAGTITETMASSSDYFPTALAAAGVDYQSPTALDGENILPLIVGQNNQREAPLFFQSHGTFVTMDQDYKLIKIDSGAYSSGAAERRSFPLDEWLLFDMRSDSGETTNIAAQHPERVEQMAKRFAEWDDSCRNSYLGHDYPAELGFDASGLTYKNDAKPKSKTKTKKKNKKNKAQ
jgi:arylsulfatase A-like enzyme